MKLSTSECYEVKYQQNNIVRLLLKQKPVSNHEHI